MIKENQITGFRRWCKEVAGVEFRGSEVKRNIENPPKSWRVNFTLFLNEQKKSTPDSRGETIKNEGNKRSRNKHHGRAK